MHGREDRRYTSVDKPEGKRPVGWMTLGIVGRIISEWVL
jgi:hypothetical protein